MGVVNRFQVAYDGLQADLDGFPDALKNLTTGEVNQLENIGTATISSGQWGYLGNLNQDLITSSTVTFATVSVNNAGLKMKDSDASHDLIFDTDSNLTLDRTLKFDIGDADRTLTINGNVTLNDWFDQSVKTTASPTFATPIITGDINFNSGSGAIQDSGTDAITFDGSQNVSVPNGSFTITSNKLLLSDVPTNLLAILDNTALAAGVGGGLTLAGVYTSGGGITTFASIEAEKENGTDGNFDGALVLKTRVNGGNAVTGIKINANQDVTIPNGDLIVSTSNPPASASATGTVGTIAWNSTHFFVCIAPDTWVRAALSTWA